MISFEWFDKLRQDDNGAYVMWFCVHQSGRIMGHVETPTVREFCHLAVMTEHQHRRYLGLREAQGWIEREARIILGEEEQQRALRRRERRGSPK